MRLKRIYLVSLLLVISLFVVLSIYNLPVNPIDTSGTSQGINYESQVCIFKNDELIQCNHNVLFNNGAEAIEQDLGNGVINGPFKNISLCNSTTAAGVNCGTVTAGQTEAYNLFSAGGLIQGAGTYFSNGNGNWTISKTFTATANSLTTNVTKLSNITGYNLSGNSFTAVSLNIDDQITINWTIWIT